MIRSVIALALISAVMLSACTPGVRWPRWPMWRDSWPPERVEKFASNGERIYLTATNERGERIAYRGEPRSGGMMMASSLACADCHGADGRGGPRMFHMQLIEAPDIRFVALVREGGDHGEEDHADEHGDYSLEDFRRAVVDGQHPDGESLGPEMPRWQMADEDLADLFEFLKLLP